MRDADDLDTTTKALPVRIEPMILAHLALTGDVEQHKEWRERIEAIRQMEAVDREIDPEAKRLLMRRRVWERVRALGKVGAVTSLAMGSIWMAILLPAYAIDFGFGWAAALAYLLPVPIAWKVGRRFWERAALFGMRDLGWRPSLKRWLGSLPRAAILSANAGFAFGFTLVFAQGLISAFMTPMPTIGAELLFDLRDGLVGGLVGAAGSLAMVPNVAKPAP